MKRLSRSDSSMIGAEQVRLSRLSLSLSARSRMRAGGAEHRGERRLQVVRDRGQQRRAQALGFGGALDPIHVLDQLHALDRQRALVASAHRAAAADPASAADPVLSLSMPMTPIGAAPGMHRQEQPLGAGQRVGAAPGRAVVLPGPFRGGEIGLVERVLRRIAGLHRDGRRSRAAAAPPAPSASARSDRRSPTARRRACRRRRACG